MLSDFAKADQDWLADLLRGISDGAEALARGDGAKFQNAVALRMQPPKPEKPKPAAKAPEAQAPEAAPDERSALQKLADRFR